MNFESVRLLHAQGVPDHFIVNQVYQPADEEQRQRGSFIILLDQAKTLDGAFLGSLVNTLIREYYRQSMADRAACLEQTLIRLNEQIRQYGRNLDEAHPLELHGIIVLLQENEIHLSHIGQPTALLRRGQEFIQLIEPVDTSEQTTPAFSVITSGEICNADILTLICALQNPAQTEEDLDFLLKHTPILEAARAYVRLLHQKHERAAEALFAQFHAEATDQENALFQVYVDRSLESPGERAMEWWKWIQHQSGVVTSGLHFTLQGIRRLFKREPRTTAARPSLTATSEIAHSLSDGFNVHVYNRRDLPPAAVAASEVTETPPALDPPKEQPSIPARPLRVPYPKLPKWNLINSKLLYFIIGVLLLVFIATRLVHFPSKLRPVKSTVDVPGILTEVEGMQREATTAQVEDDNSKAIASLLKAIELLGQIPEAARTEEVKAQAERTQTTLNQVTQTVELKAEPSALIAVQSPRKIVSLKDGAFIFFADGEAEKLTANALEPVSDLTSGNTFIDAIAYNNFANVAVLTAGGETEKLFSLDSATDAVKETSRTDNKAWPPAKYLASYDINVYLVGSSMWKSVPKDNKFRVFAYATDYATTNLTGIVNNGVFFYGVENNQLIRIANNSPKTAVKFNGVPDVFLPTSITRLVDSRKEGILYLFDAAKQRIMEFSTDGAYHKQFALPSGAKYIDCDTTATGFICATDQKEIKRLTIAAS